MKTYRLISLGLVAFALASCDDGLDRDVSVAGVTVTENENVVSEGVTVNVKKGEPVIFNFTGDPDNIVFYSGEDGHNYDFRNRTTIDISQIESSELSFTIKTLWGNANAYKNTLHMYMSTNFNGLYKDDFEADCKLVQEFQWDTWIADDVLPTNGSQTIPYTMDMTPYIGQNITFAISYQGQTLEAAQPRYEFHDMKITNVYKNGKIVEVPAIEFGFTPVNVSSVNPDPKQVTGLQKDGSFWDSEGNLITEKLQYGTIAVSSDVEGMWSLYNLSNSGGYFYIHSSTSDAKGENGVSLKNSWLVSDYLVVNSCSPDQGVAVKNMSNNITSYDYTYNEIGTYKAVFVMTNSNYKNEDSKVVTMIINVK